MATYKEVKGITVQTLDADPVLNVGSWSAGGSLNAGRRGISERELKRSTYAGGGPATVPLLQIKQKNIMELAGQKLMK